MSEGQVAMVKMIDLPQSFAGCELILVVDSNIYQKYRTVVLNLCTNDESRIWIAPAGEEAKTMNSFEDCLNHFLARGVHRQTQLLAIGGGAVSDLAGFVAATLLRGINWSVVPTSLLAMIDAAIGGKTGLNTIHGKNLLGAFHMPLKVYIDTNFLKTLPEDQFQSGLGELVKYAFLSEEIQNEIQASTGLEKLIELCVNYKLSVVAADFKEKGSRKFLNFGHTLGHALEKHYKISHGEAVLWGCYLIIQMYTPQHLNTFIATVRKLKVGFHNPPWRGNSLAIEEIIKHVSKDKKKVDAQQVELIIVNDIGKPSTKVVGLVQLAQRLREMKNDIETFHL